MIKQVKNFGTEKISQNILIATSAFHRSTQTNHVCSFMFFFFLPTNLTCTVHMEWIHYVIFVQLKKKTEVRLTLLIACVCVSVCARVCVFVKYIVASSITKHIYTVWLCGLLLVVCCPISDIEFGKREPTAATETKFKIE